VKASASLSLAAKVLLGGFLLVGAIAIILRVAQGLRVTHLSSITPWGLWVILYIYFVGLSAGAFLLSSLVYVFGQHNLEKVGRRALFLAVLSMVVALTFILLDLGHIERFWLTLRFWNTTSILAWEVHFYMVYILLLLAELYLAMRKDLVQQREKRGLMGLIARLFTWNDDDLSEKSLERDRKLMRLLGIVGIPLAVIGVHGGTGTLFAVVKARPYWNTGLFPVIFILSALVSGTAFLLVIQILTGKKKNEPEDLEISQALAKFLAGFLLIDLGLEFYEFLIPLYSLRHEEMESLYTLFTGPLSFYFWVGQILLVFVLPLVLLYSSARHSSKALALAGVSVVLGIVAVRVNIVLPALLVPVLEGLPIGRYYPSLIEVLSSLGIISLGILLYIVGEYLLPLAPSDIKA